MRCITGYEPARLYGPKEQRAELNAHGGNPNRYRW